MDVSQKIVFSTGLEDALVGESLACHVFGIGPQCARGLEEHKVVDIIEDTLCGDSCHPMAGWTNSCKIQHPTRSLHIYK